jgi:hypothetical protein
MTLLKLTFSDAPNAPIYAHVVEFEGRHVKWTRYGDGGPVKGTDPIKNLKRIEAEHDTSRPEGITD